MCSKASHRKRRVPMRASIAFGSAARAGAAATPRCSRGLAPVLPSDRRAALERPRCGRARGRAVHGRRALYARDEGFGALRFARADGRTEPGAQLLSPAQRRQVAARRAPVRRRARVAPRRAPLRRERVRGSEFAPAVNEPRRAGVQAVSAGMENAARPRDEVPHAHRETLARRPVCVMAPLLAEAPAVRVAKRSSPQARRAWASARRQPSFIEDMTLVLSSNVDDPSRRERMRVLDVTRTRCSPTRSRWGAPRWSWRCAHLQAQLGAYLADAHAAWRQVRDAFRDAHPDAARELEGLIARVDA